MKILKYGLLVATMYLFSGCVGQPSIPKVDEVEVGKYEKNYMAEYERIKKENGIFDPKFKLIQAQNKKEECKISLSTKFGDRSQEVGFSLFWDGECKNGYAHGIGRAILNTLVDSTHSIGYFENGKERDYYNEIKPLIGVELNGIVNGDDGSGHFVITQVDDKNGNLNISYEYGFFSLQKLRSSIKTYPFYDVVEYFKSYPNFSYVIVDLTTNEFDNRKYEFNIEDHKTGKYNGYGFAIMKQGFTNAGEMSNGTLVRRVQLPQSYFNNANTIFSEIKKEANIALEAQKKALIIKEKYKNKICKDSVKVDFMDNKEYKAICKEDEKIAQLKTKIDAKLAQIEQQKQAKRQQQNEQRLIQAREAEAIAAQRRAAAAEQANNQAAWDSVNRSIQNMNNNIQMQQLNNNLMMYNYMPKRYDVYLH